MDPGVPDSKAMFFPMFLCLSPLNTLYLQTKLFVLGLTMGEAWSLPEMCVWAVPNPAPSAWCQSVWLTFLGFLEMIVLC